MLSYRVLTQIGPLRAEWALSYSGYRATPCTGATLLVSVYSRYIIGGVIVILPTHQVSYLQVGLRQGVKDAYGLCAGAYVMSRAQLYLPNGTPCLSFPSRDFGLLVVCLTQYSPTMAKDEDTCSSTMPIADTTNATELSVKEQDVTQYPTGVKLVVIMASLMLGTTLMSLDTTIISVATPKISTQFHALDDVGWYGAAYLMTLTAATPIAANFYKYFNPKYVYLAFIAIFEGELATTKVSPSAGRRLIIRSWIHRLCFSTHFFRLHHRQSHRRLRSCRTATGSIWSFDICVYT